MGNEILLIVGFTVFSLVVTMAWVAGYLDEYQQYVPLDSILTFSHFFLNFETCPRVQYMSQDSIYIVQHAILITMNSIQYPSGYPFR